MNKKNIFIGLTIILLGILFLLFTFNILTLNLLTMIIGIYLIINYIIFSNSFLLYISIATILISIINMISRSHLEIIDIRLFGYLLVGSIISFVLYIKKRRNANFILISVILFSISMGILSSQILDINMIWISFILSGIGFFISYILDYRSFGIVWPKYISYILIGIGLILLGFMVSLFKIFNIRYIIPIIIIIVGIIITYKNLNSEVKHY